MKVNNFMVNRIKNIKSNKMKKILDILFINHI